MDFAEAWESLAIGDRVKVSNGQPEPVAGPTTMAYKCWRSHNFEGELVERVDAATRGLTIKQDPWFLMQVSYTVYEGFGHSFDAL